MRPSRSRHASTQLAVPAGVSRSRNPGQVTSARSRRLPSATSRIALLIAVSVNRIGITPSRGASLGLHRGFNTLGFSATPWDVILTGLQGKRKRNRRLLIQMGRPEMQGDGGSLADYGNHNPLVGGSNPPAATTGHKHRAPTGSAIVCSAIPPSFSRKNSGASHSAPACLTRPDRLGPPGGGAMAAVRP